MRWKSLLAAAILLASYGLFLVRHASFAVGGADSSGYINTARRLLAGTLVSRPRSLDRLGLPGEAARVVTPLGFLAGPRPGTMAPLYPVGFPAHLALAAALFGWQIGPYLVSPIAALLCLLILYLLARDFGLPPVWSASTALLFALWPVFLFQALQPMSDIVATLWSLAAILFARRSRARPAWALAAGAAFGIAVLVRPTNVLLALPLAFALPMSGRSLVLFGAGGLPFFGLFAAYDLHCYGGIFRTGYGETGHFQALALSNSAVRLRYYGLWFLKTLTPLVPLAWLGLLLGRRGSLRDRALLVSWFAAYLLLFSFYGPYQSFVFVRFLLPGAPALVLGATIVVRRLLSHPPRRSALIATILGVAVLIVEVRGIRRVGVLDIIRDQSVYPETCRWAAGALPRESVVVAMQESGALEYYTDLTYAVWSWIDAGNFARLREDGERRGRRWFALLFPNEMEEFAQHVPGRWTKIGEKRGVALYRLEP